MGPSIAAAQKNFGHFQPLMVFCNHWMGPSGVLILNFYPHFVQLYLISVTELINGHLIVKEAQINQKYLDFDRFCPSLAF